MEKERRGTAKYLQLTFIQLPKPCPNCLGYGQTDTHTHGTQSGGQNSFRSPCTLQNTAGYKAPGAGSSYSSSELLLWYY